jgi:hypothetical protein
VQREAAGPAALPSWTGSTRWHAGRARRLGRALLLLVAVAVAATAVAQGADLSRPLADPVAVRLQGIWRLVAAADLARALGAHLDVTDGVLTLRARHGVLTAFAHAPDAVWHAAGAAAPDDIAAASPVTVVDGRWYLPEDMVGVLGVRVDGDTLALPDGQVRALVVLPPDAAPPTSGAEVVALAPGVQALRLYAESPSGPASVSLLVVDLGMLALAFPEQREALDAQVRALHAEKALFLVVTSLGPAAWEPALYVRQDDVEVLLRAPLAVQVLEGEPADLRPGAPVAAVAFLPSSFDLRRPLHVRWAGASGSLTLRR